ncbi:hypothetical protein IAR55_001999 [Kwoniella newhampshirensis]|uniref:FAD dependent oxidoreductase domain-containing protein n=1 Tax=Kwoniella newhampshirensis TaxID=1651941 RepID=A0AAW0Z3R4_9TREE
MLNHRTTEDVPIEADVVVVGSGLSGALVALSLLEGPMPPQSVVMLEARELCSGATGKNAGHCKPDIWRGFNHYAELFGAQEALKNERETWEAAVRFVKQHGVDCDLWVGKTLDVLMDETSLKEASLSFEAFKAAGGDPTPIQATADPEEAEKAVYAWDASTLHPFKLGLNLQTWTPASSITGTDNRWVVHTERGCIKTPTVIHATNAFAATLLPETETAIIPTPHMCDRVYPPASFSGIYGLKHSYAVISTKGLYSINPRSTSDGAILFGGTIRNMGRQLVTTIHGAGSLETASTKYLSSARCQESPARIFTCSPALAKLVNGSDWADVNLPDCFRVTRERLSKATP